MRRELKPCPFCGGKADLYVYKWWGTAYGVECQKCKGLIDRCLTQKEAIAAWNRRAKNE